MTGIRGPGVWFNPRVSLTATIAVGAAIGFALGIVVSVTTDVPLAPEAGLVLGGLGGWLFRRDAA
jgi:hypothetical protein